MATTMDFIDVKTRPHAANPLPIHPLVLCSVLILRPSTIFLKVLWWATPRKIRHDGYFRMYM